MFTVLFWKATFERAVSTAAEFALVLLGTDMLGYLEVDWYKLLIVSLVGGLTAVLKALATAGATDGAPSIGNVEKLR